MIWRCHAALLTTMMVDKRKEQVTQMRSLEKRLAGPLLHASGQKYGGLVRSAPVMKKQGRIEGSGEAFGIGKQMFSFLPAVGVVQPICPIH